MDPCFSTESRSSQASGQVVEAHLPSTHIHTHLTKRKDNDACTNPKHRPNSQMTGGGGELSLAYIYIYIVVKIIGDKVHVLMHRDAASTSSCLF